MTKLIIPPLFSIRGKLNIGQAMTLVISDALIRYYSQCGKEVLFHSKSYNSQGIPMEKIVESNNFQLDDYINHCKIKAEELIESMEKDKEKLSLIEGGFEYLDHSECSKNLAQEKFIELYLKKDKGALKKGTLVMLYTFGYPFFGSGLRTIIKKYLQPIYLLSFTAFISINLAIINLLPIPALDGGRILFVVIEAIKGSAIKPKVANTLNTIGFALLIILMVVVTFNDIIRLF